MIYYDTTYITIYWDEPTRCVHTEWKAFVAGEQVRTVQNKGLELLIAKRTNRWLGDLREAKVLNKQDQDWISENWLPRAFAAGLRYSAYVVPKSLLAQMSLKAIVSKDKDEKHPERAYFDNLEEAKKWLKSK